MNNLDYITLYYNLESFHLGMQKKVLRTVPYKPRIPIQTGYFEKRFRKIYNKQMHFRKVLLIKVKEKWEKPDRMK